MRGPVIFFDTETGGLFPHHPTIQLAAVAVGPDWQELGTFERKILFDVALADPEALKMNHFDADTWAREAKPEAIVVAGFATFIESHRSVTLKSARTGRPYTAARLAGHNVVGFDLERLSAMFKKQGQFFAVDFRTVLDTRYGAVWHFEQRPDEPQPADFKLTGLAAHFGIETTGAHEALTDVRLSIELAKRLLAK